MADISIGHARVYPSRWITGLKRGGVRLWLGGVQVTLLLGGTVLVERIFSYEGIGNMAIDAVINRDFPLIQGLVLTFAVMFIALNLVVDFVVALLDPRLRHG